MMLVECLLAMPANFKSIIVQLRNTGNVLIGNSLSIKYIVCKLHEVYMQMKPTAVVL